VFFDSFCEISNHRLCHCNQTPQHVLQRLNEIPFPGQIRTNCIAIFPPEKSNQAGSNPTFLIPENRTKFVSNHQIVQLTPTKHNQNSEFARQSDFAFFYSRLNPEKLTKKRVFNENPYGSRLISSSSLMLCYAHWKKYNCNFCLDVVFLAVQESRKAWNIHVWWYKFESMNKI